MHLRLVIICLLVLGACGSAGESAVDATSAEATAIEATTTSAPSTTSAPVTTDEPTTTTEAPVAGCATLEEIVELDAAFDPATADATAFDAYFADGVRLRERLQGELPGRGSLNAMGATTSAGFIADIHAGTGHDLARTGEFFRDTRTQGVDLTSGESAIVIYAETRCDLAMAPLHAIFSDE